MRHRLAAALLAGMLAGALAGCAGEDSNPQETPTTLHPTTDSPEPSDSPEPTDGATDLPENVQEAVEDLADRLGVAAAAVDAGSLEEVTWPDGSLGCPEPGRSYPQVLTDGYRVVLMAGGDEYAYHAGENGELAYCADPSDPVAGDTQEY